jgi:hypothetical protein
VIGIGVAVAGAVATLAAFPRSPAFAGHVVTRTGLQVASTASQIGTPQLQASPRTVRAGATVAIRGTDWQVGRTGCARVVRLSAFALGISPYPAVTIKAAAVPASGQFRREWVTPHLSDQYAWGIEARQPCPGKPRVKQVNVVILPG